MLTPQYMLPLADELVVDKTRNRDASYWRAYKESRHV